jgi:hypothetical protein
MKGFIDIPFDNVHLSNPRERRRWHWRSEKLLLNSLPIRLLTYDQLYDDLAVQLARITAPV